MEDRKTLKNLFKKGKLPGEESFGKLIDSSINKIDDGFSKSVDDGLMLSSIGKEKRVLSLYDSIQDEDAAWVVELEKEGQGLSFRQPNEEESDLFISSDKKVGIGTSNPQSTLEVNGAIGAKASIGTFARGTVKADGDWHTIVSDLNYCNILEIVARTGIVKTGHHAVMHAVASSAYGNSRSTIKQQQARFSFWRPLRMKLRWTGSTYRYGLQIKTTRKLADQALINYSVKVLYSDELMGIDQHFKRE